MFLKFWKNKKSVNVSDSIFRDKWSKDPYGNRIVQIALNLTFDGEYWILTTFNLSGCGNDNGKITRSFWVTIETLNDRYEQIPFKPSEMGIENYRKALLAEV